MTTFFAWTLLISLTAFLCSLVSDNTKPVVLISVKFFGAVLVLSLIGLTVSVMI